MARPIQLVSFLLASAFAPSALAQQTGVPLDLGAGGQAAAPTGVTPGEPAPQVDASPAKSLSTLSMDPAAPEMSSLPGGVTPAFGTLSTQPGDWRFDYHGLLFVPLRVGFNTRLAPAADQSKLVLHAPPVVPENFQGFEYTNVVPDPWAQVNFSYGNRDVTATVIIAARSVTEGDSYFNPPDQLGINDAFVTFRELSTDRIRLKLDVGAFANRYGNMGEYDSGRYGTPVIARLGGVGATQTGTYDFGDGTFMAEVGLMGQLNKAPLGVEPAGWNGYLDPNVGTSFAPHAHVGVSYRGLGELGLHFLSALSQDDRATPTTQPDGHIDVLAVDARLTMRRYGHFYIAASEVASHHARAVSDVIQILNAPGGPGLMAAYFGPNSQGSGDLTTVAAQYDLSVGNLLRYPRAFNGLGPDLVVSLFGIFTSVQSSDPSTYATGRKLYDGINKLKYGAEVSYAPLSWLAFSGRYDRVIRDLDDATQTTVILSPRVIFRSGYNARDQLVLQYSHWYNGSNVVVNSGAPPLPDPSIRPDQDVLSLMVSMWW
ncbi:MAG TPA: hypothetical protein VGM06_16895 [Polyangiaceae bacterium]